jgi:CheY-like chemotaxis protein
MRPLVNGDILLVEDDASIRDTLRELLEDEGYRVLGAENGVEALRQLRSCAPHVILLDLMMPVMDGWELRKELQQDSALARIPVVIVSADHMLDQKVGALAAQAYLAKPFELEALLSTIRRLCPPAPASAGALCTA